MEKVLLQPVRMGGLALKNRVVYPAMSFKLSDHKGHLTEAEVESMLYRAKQKYGPGLIVFPGLNDTMQSSPVTAVNINSDEAMFSLKRQLARFHAYDVKVVAQIGVLGYQINPLGQKTGGVACGASDLRHPVAFRSMTMEEIAVFRKKHRDMARRAKAAGFDAIQLQTEVNKKILGNFLSPRTNTRSDDYGGSTENRARLLLEVLQDTREVVGEEFPVILNLRVDDLLGERGLQLEEGLKIARMAAPYVTAINPFAGSDGFSADNSYASYFTPPGLMLPYVKALREALPDMFIMAGCKLGDPALAEAAICDAGADMVILGRPLFADPQWLVKVAEGRSEEILHCIGCLNCYTEATRKDIYPTQRACTVNPCNLRECAFYSLQPVDASKRILVVGGGLAGMEAAATLAARGHDVTLCEASDHLGGQFYVASQESDKGAYRTLIPAKARALAASGAAVYMEKRVDRALLEEIQPDIVVLATGAVPKSLPLRKDCNMQVVQGNDVFLERVETGERVVVIGGRFVGLGAALKLSEEGKQVTVVDQGAIASGLHQRLVNHYNERLVANDVAFYPNCPVVEILDDAVEIMHLGFPVKLSADTVVQAIGTQSVNDLVPVLEKMQIPYVAIGDCKRIGDALCAIRDGAEIGRML